MFEVTIYPERVVFFVDLPIWMEIILLFLFISIVIYVCLRNYFVKLVHKYYDLDMTRKGEKKEKKNDKRTRSI